LEIEFEHDPVTETLNRHLCPFTVFAHLYVTVTAHLRAF